jgi:thiosulfate/3-mercaptopyruvate sulfurtransferase
MPAPADSTPKFLEYANPEVLVTADWVAQNLDNPDVVVVESDEDVLLPRLRRRSRLQSSYGT